MLFVLLVLYILGFGAQIAAAFAIHPILFILALILLA
jgi:hypothetical protein